MGPHHSSITLRWLYCFEMWATVVVVVPQVTHLCTNPTPLLRCINSGAAHKLGLAQPCSCPPAGIHAAFGVQAHTSPTHALLPPRYYTTVQCTGQHRRCTSSWTSTCCSSHTATAVCCQTNHTSVADCFPNSCKLLLAHRMHAVAYIHAGQPRSGQDFVHHVVDLGLDRALDLVYCVVLEPLDGMGNVVCNQPHLVHLVRSTQQACA